MRLVEAHQIDLVGDDEHRQLLRLRAHEIAIQHARMKIRLGTRKHEHDNIQVGDDDLPNFLTLLTVRAAHRIDARERADARLHSVDAAVDQPFTLNWLDRHSVTDGQHILLMPALGQAASRLAHKCGVVHHHGEEATVRFGDEAVDIGHSEVGRSYRIEQGAIRLLKSWSICQKSLYGIKSSLPLVARLARARCASGASFNANSRSMRMLSLPDATQPSTSFGRPSSSSRVRI